MFVGHKSCCTAASSRNGAIGWISMQGYGNLTKAVGIPCKAWKSIQCMESPPGVGWKSNQVLQNTWMEIQPSYSKIHNNNPQKLMSNMKVNVNCCNLMKVKVNCYNLKSLNDEMNVFFSRNGKLFTATSIGHRLLSWRDQVEEKGQEGQDVHMARQKGLGVLHGVSSTSFVGRHHDEGGGGL